jgi:hypothetical protein
MKDWFSHLERGKTRSKSMEQGQHLAQQALF